MWLFKRMVRKILQRRRLLSSRDFIKYTGLGEKKGSLRNGVVGADEAKRSREDEVGKDWVQIKWGITGHGEAF